MTENDLVRRHTPLARQLAGQFARGVLRREKDAALSVALEALLVAIRRHDPARGMISTLAHVAIRHSLINWARRERRRLARERTSPSAGDDLCDDDPPWRQLQEDEAVRLAFGRANAADRAVFRDRFWVGLKLHQLAPGRCKQAGAARLTAALNRARTRLVRAGYEVRQASGAPIRSGKLAVFEG